MESSIPSKTHSEFPTKFRSSCLECRHVSLGGWCLNRESWRYDRNVAKEIQCGQFEDAKRHKSLREASTEGLRAMAHLFRRTLGACLQAMRSGTQHGCAQVAVSKDMAETV